MCSVGVYLLGRYLGTGRKATGPLPTGGTDMGHNDLVATCLTSMEATHARSRVWFGTGTPLVSRCIDGGVAAMSLDGDGPIRIVCFNCTPGVVYSQLHRYYSVGETLRQLRSAWLFPHAGWGRWQRLFHCRRKLALFWAVGLLSRPMWNVLGDRLLVVPKLRPQLMCPRCGGWAEGCGTALLTSCSLASCSIASSASGRGCVAK